MLRLPLLLTLLTLCATGCNPEDEPPPPKGDAGTQAPAAARDEPVRVGLVRVERDGTYLISRAQLETAGARSPWQAEVRRGGLPVPMQTQQPGIPPGALAFAARDVATPHSRFAIFELWTLPAPRPAPADDAPPPAPVPLRREIATDRVLGELAAAEPGIYDPRRSPAQGPLPVWFVGYTPPGKLLTFDLGPQGATPGRPQVLEAVVYGNWNGLVSMEATWDGHDLGAAAAPHAIGGAVLQWTIPGHVVPAARARLALRNVSPPPPPPPARDVSARRGTIFVDRIRLVGEATHVARWEDARPVEVLPGGAPADPLAKAGSARHVILATPPLLAPSQRLAAHRTSQGLPSVVVPVDEVYDRYGHGEATPAAIQSFLADLRARAGAPLAYLLLAGDATYDRTDLIEAITIPTPMARTIYNGATSADRLYAPFDAQTNLAPALGRLPFRQAEVMDAYVDRVIRYETSPPADATRRMLRFLTSPGRFGAFIDGLIEGKFKAVVAGHVPPAYDIRVTFASASSPYVWPPPEFNEKVLDEINEGALFFTYVGHGFAQGFDTLQVGRARFPILHVKDAPRIRVRGTPPVLFVLACTTAMFDETHQEGIGEALMKRPEGPIAYWGASRICHPGYNALMGEALAKRMAQGTAETRLGTIFADALAEARDAKRSPLVRLAITQLSGASADRLVEEGALMYTLLGDPALRVAFPKNDLQVTGRVDAARRVMVARVEGPLPAGTRVHVSLERPRNRPRAAPHAISDPSDPGTFDRIRANHAAVNDLTISRVEAVVSTPNVLEVDLPLMPGDATSGVILKAWTVSGDRVRQGAVRLE